MKVINAEQLGSTFRTDMLWWWSERKDMLKIALLECGEVLANHAARTAPVDTGDLKNSIRVQSHTNDEVIVGDGVKYGVYQEYGTSKMNAQPFMRPAIYSSKYERDLIIKEVFK